MVFNVHFIVVYFFKFILIFFIINDYSNGVHIFSALDKFEFSVFKPVCSKRCTNVLIPYRKRSSNYVRIDVLHVVFVLTFHYASVIPFSRFFLCGKYEVLYNTCIWEISNIHCCGKAGSFHQMEYQWKDRSQLCSIYYLKSYKIVRWMYLSLLVDTILALLQGALNHIL